LGEWFCQEALARKKGRKERSSGVYRSSGVAESVD
jgi:hypothetical protein